MNTVVSNTV